MKRKFIWWLGFVTLFVLFSVTAYGDSWPTYHGNYARTGANGASIDPNTLTLDWFFEPGVGNPLNPGSPNGTGLPVGNGGQSSIIGFGKVFYGYLDNVGQDVLVALDASTGAYLWSKVIRLPGLGAGFIQVPTVAERDTGGPAPDTAVYVYGTNNSVWALNANTGATLWNRTGINGSGATMRSGAPIVFDTTLICHDNGGAGTARRFVSALSTRNGSTVWTSAQMPFRIFLGPSLSNDTLFVSGRGNVGVAPDNGGQVVALNAHTGATLATYDPVDPYNWQHSPVVFGPYVVSVSRNDLLGSFLGSVHRLSHDLATALVRPIGGTSIGPVRFSTPEVYIEPSVGETTIIYGTAGRATDNPPGDIVMRRLAPGISLRNYTQTVGQIHGPGAVAAGNGLLLQGDDAGYWYALDANTYGAPFAGSFAPFWAKQYPGHLTAGAAISPDDDTLVAMIDGNGNCAGWRNGSVATRSRAQLYYDPTAGDAWGILRTEVVMGITPTDPATGNGGFSETTLYCFQNSGNADLTYQLDWGSSPVALSASDFGGTIALSLTHPGRERTANKFAAENTVTSANGFMEKKYDLGSKSVKDAIDMEEDGITSLKEIQDLYHKAAYFGTTRLQEAKSSMAQLGWLFVNDVTEPPIAPGAPCSLRLVAVNPNVGFGLFFGEVKMFGTNEPDVQGNPLDTTRLPIILAIGYLGSNCDLLADDTLPTGLTVTNYGRVIKQAPLGFLWKGVYVGYDGSFELGANDTTFAGMLPSSPTADPPVASAFNGWKSDSTCGMDIGPYTDGITVQMSRHATKLAHLAAAYSEATTNLPLLVHEYGWAFREPIPGSPHAQEALFTTIVVSCTGSVAVDSVKLGAWADDDIGSGTGNNGSMLANNDAVWQYDTPIPEQLFGIARVPGDTGTVGPGVSGTATMFTSAHGSSGGIEWFPHDPVAINDQFNSGFKGQIGTHPQDLHTYNGSRIVSLAPGQHYTVTYIWFGADTTGETGNINVDLLQNRLKEWLRLCGYYRGDARGNGGTQLDDVQHLSNYVTKGGPAPLPFASQGDVNNDGLVDAADISYLYDFVTTSGATAAPIDYDRFVPDPWKNTRPSLNDDAIWTP